MTFKNALALVVEMVHEKGWRSAIFYLSENQRIKATRQNKKEAGWIIVSIGKPNYRERADIQAYKKEYRRFHPHWGAHA